MDINYKCYKNIKSSLHYASWDHSNFDLNSTLIKFGWIYLNISLIHILKIIGLSYFKIGLDSI